MMSRLHQKITDLAMIGALGLIVLAFVNTTALAQIDLSGALETDSQAEEAVVTVTPVFSVTSAAPGDTYDAAVVVFMETGWHINSESPYHDWAIPAELEFDTIPGLTPHSVVYPESRDVILLEERMSVFSDSAVIRFKITVDESAQTGEYDVPARLTYQSCNDKLCRAPETEEMALTVTVGEEGDSVSPELFSVASDEAPPAGEVSDEASVEPVSDLQKLIDEHGFWGYFIALGLAFVTGLLLSFSPCTYPMIPITVSVFAGQERSLWGGFVLSLFYVGSMAIVYGLMGLIVSLVGGVFGAWLASPPVVIGIAVVFVIFALSMFGLYELQIPASLRNKLGGAGRGGGVIGSIVLGVVAALVVSPCVGPFVAGILLYVATTGSPLIGFVVLFVFALGLGTLFMIIGTFSSAISALPGAGGWMETVKKFFGFVLLIMALYFVRTIIPPGVTAVLAGLLLLAFGVFGGGLDRLSSESGFFQRLKKFLGVLAFLIGVYLLLGTMLMQGFVLPPASSWLPVSGAGTASAETDLIDWGTDLDAELARAESENKPVLIDTWATWCINCRVLDKKTFHNPDVAEEARRFVSIKVQLENANSQITKDFMEQFGLRHFSLPTTLLLDPDGGVRKVMQGFVGPEQMIEEMQKVR